MTTNFHYVPATPDPISGKAVLEQTEGAFNELGATIETTNERAETALSVANTALSTAGNALETAEDAVGKSQEALNATAVLDGRVTIAEGVAADAADRADTAYDMAAVAGSKADAATENAENALTKAEQAIDTANTALDSATTAESNAASAMERASSIPVRYTLTDTDETPVDLNDSYVEKTLLYLIGSRIANAPADASFPAWFSAEVNSRKTAVIQTLRPHNDGKVWTRTASVEWSVTEEPEEGLEDDPQAPPAEPVEAVPVIVWSPWSTGSSGASSGIPSGFIGMWSGTTDVIPEGWALCDGQSGTPDLRDRFVMGGGGTNAPHAQGGSANHSHTATSSSTTATNSNTTATNNGTTLTVSTMPAHKHAFYGSLTAGTAGKGSSINAGSNAGIYAETYTRTVLTASIDNTGGGGSHTHTQTAHTHTQAAHNHTLTVKDAPSLPPYYALCFIMKR